MENCWWTEKAHQIQQYADNNELQKFYEAVKAVHGPRQHSIHPVKSKDGSTLIKDRQGILCRWAEHLSELLNCINPHGLHWWHKVTHAEIRTRTNDHCMEHLVMQRQLRWVGHVIRMQSNRLPRRILYSELQHGQRAAGGQKKRFSDHIKATLRKCPVPPDQLEVLAADRDTWRDVCEEGLAAFDISYNQEAEVRRARRHTVTSVPTSGPRCHNYGRTCVSDFGLRSHLRSHRPSLTTS